MASKAASGDLMHNARRARLARSLKPENGADFQGARAVNQVHVQKVLSLRSSVNEDVPKKKDLGIIGAGISGMYTAYLLNQKYKDKFNIQVLESTDRIGGRIRTHKFDDDQFQYGEFGAMRIPELHQEVLALFDALGVKKIPFIFSNPKSLFYLNGKKNGDEIMTKEYADAHTEELGFMTIRVHHPKIHELPYQPAYFGVIDLYLFAHVDASKYKSVATLYNAAYAGLADELDNNYEGFFDKYDKYTVYGYFHDIIHEWLKTDCVNYDEIPKSHIRGLIDSILHYAETTSTATGLNHLALTESVLDNRNFQDNQPWWTAENGMEHFTDALHASLIKDGTIVRKSTPVLELIPASGEDHKVRVRLPGMGIQKTGHLEAFDRVVVTAPFQSARYFIKPSAPFTYGKRQAIRTLNYDHSTKVFVQFDSGRWWEQLANPQKGGASITDLPVRTVVYPSYGVGTEGKGVLLCSYTWQNDAIMLANADESLLKQTVKESLAELHNKPDLINDEGIRVASHTWLEAFALFGPGQFNLMVNAMIPELGVHFAGEHLSTYHAWIIGALNSATRAVREILVLEGILTAEEAWKEYPDNEFSAETWLKYMENVKAL